MEDTWDQSRQRVNDALTRQDGEIKEGQKRLTDHMKSIYKEVGEVEDKINECKEEFTGQMAAIDVKLDLLHSYSKIIVTSVLTAAAGVIVFLLTRPFVPS